ncbi:hypothetical protein BGX29_012252 [Mortierella sp. GBA35]|nr:hypothetical protein BGX29_012252 [Mortierella sp. GBA35]
MATAASINNDDTVHFDNNGNIVPAGQINITRNDTRPATIRVLDTAELVNHIIRYLPASSYRACSQINPFWHDAIIQHSLTYGAFNNATRQQFEATPHCIYILSAFILQYSPAIDSGLSTGSGDYQFVFSCQTRSDSSDSYGSSNSDGKSGENSCGGHTTASGEISGVSHLQRHHTHQPGHDVEPYASFHTYQSSAIVPNVYFKTGIQLPPHLSSPPPVPPLPTAAAAAQHAYNFSSSAQQSPAQSIQQQSHHPTTTGFMAGNAPSYDAMQTIDQSLGYPLPLPHHSADPGLSSSSSDLQPYEADTSTDSNTSSILVDVAEMSLSPGQLLLPDGLSTFSQQHLQHHDSAALPPIPPLHSSSSSSSAASTSIPIPARHQQLQQQQHPTSRVVPCPYEIPNSPQVSRSDSASVHHQQQQQQYEEHIMLTKKGSRTSSGSGHSVDSSSGGSGGSDPSSPFLQGSYLPYASPIMEEDLSSSGHPSALAYGRFERPAGRSGIGSSSGGVVYPGQGQGHGGGPRRSRSGKERALEYQRSIQEQEQLRRYQLQHQHQQHLHQGQRIDPRDAMSMAHSSDTGDLVMETTSGGEMSDLIELRRRGSAVTTRTTSSSSYGTSSHHHHHHQHQQQRRHRESVVSSVQVATSSSSGGTTHHHHQHTHHTTKPSRNWSMAIQTFYYQGAALNAMIKACREHMLSREGQGGHIVERTETSRIIWNETTRQEHIWTITPTLMDRSNPGDFVEKDYDPHSENESGSM